jgi:hypothetical protein
LSGWQYGLSRSALIPAGRNRMLVFCPGFENGGGVVKSLTSVTYGGQAMTRAAISTTGTAGGFSGTVEIWILNEVGIAAASSNNFVVTELAGVETEIVRWHGGSIVFQHVDQFVPVSASSTVAINGSTNPIVLPTTAVLKGSMAVSFVMSGAPNSAGSACGSSNVTFIPQTAGYTEGLDSYTCNATCCAGSGASFETATASFAAIGTTAPSFSFQGTPNRMALAVIILQRARELDVNVRLVKAGVIQATNYALTTTAWPETDAYQSYGGAADLWGTTWTPADINNSGFGAAVSARTQNGTAAIDHIRITVFLTSTLPIELLGFDAKKEGGDVKCYWSTATEVRSSHFDVERSEDGINFETIGRVEAAGESYSFKHYEFKDSDPLEGTNYYRLKKVDIDNSYDYSQIKAVQFDQDGELLIYPNPGYNLFTIEEKQFKSGSIAVFTEDGKLVKEVEHPNTHKFILNLSDVADGTYIVVLEENGQRRVKKVIKQSREH